MSEGAIVVSVRTPRLTFPWREVKPPGAVPERQLVKGKPVAVKPRTLEVPGLRDEAEPRIQKTLPVLCKSELERSAPKPSGA